ncbi:hypothetical protein EVAR_96785_1 [Eumeta japonica]|uniref:Uncharacterized protein n=1 Tax=Eumeta variegata TaxID=151549 RepID=A0A4C1WR65_EUMVA|nr:hypothetical protein EVAR_96785_1 [Eumeta japonica]
MKIRNALGALERFTAHAFKRKAFKQFSGFVALAGFDTTVRDSFSDNTHFCMFRAIAIFRPSVHAPNSRVSKLITSGPWRKRRAFILRGLFDRYHQPICHFPLQLACCGGLYQFANITTLLNGVEADKLKGHLLESDNKGKCINKFSTIKKTHIYAKFHGEWLKDVEADMLQFHMHGTTLRVVEEIEAGTERSFMGSRTATILSAFLWLCSQE